MKEFRYPIHDVCAWIGNTERIAAKHYLQVTEDYFTRAAAKSGAESGAREAQNPAQGQAAPSCADADHASKEPEFVGIARQSADERNTAGNEQVGSPGLEPGTPAFSVPCSTN